MKILMVLAMGVLVVAATTAKAMDSDAIPGRFSTYRLVQISGVISHEIDPVDVLEVYV